MAIDESSDTSALEDALGGMFEPPPKAEKVAVEPIPDTPEGDEALADEILASEDEQVEAKASEPAPADYEIEVDGQKLVVPQDQVKELLQKGAHYSKNSEQVARVREALVAQTKALQDSQAFQQAIVGDVAALQQIDSQLEYYDRIDWGAAIDSDFVSAMKMQEQRAQLRQAKQNKLNEINQKQAYHQQSQAQAASQILASEGAALVAKLPEWRNSEKARAEQQSIAKTLSEFYGFNQAEIGSLMDHRQVMVARDAAKYRALLASKDGQVKQVRDAPPVSKPGAARVDGNGKADFTKARTELRKLGQQGKSHAQEVLVTKMLNRAFK